MILSMTHVARVPPIVTRLVFHVPKMIFYSLYLMCSGSSGVRAVDCRSTGPSFKSGSELFLSPSDLFVESFFLSTICRIPTNMTWKTEGLVELVMKTRPKS
jgi:hypothetical protein